MSIEFVTALAAAVAALVAALGVLLVKSRLSDVIASPSQREETAVAQMANILERSVRRDEKTIDQILAMLDKSLDTVASQTGAMQQIAIALHGHERDSTLRWTTERDVSSRIITMMEKVQDTVADLEKLVTDIALEIIKNRQTEMAIGDD